jgi:hypothetical protein
VHGGDNHRLPLPDALEDTPSRQSPGGDLPQFRPPLRPAQHQTAPPSRPVGPPERPHAPPGQHSTVEPDPSEEPSWARSFRATST